MPCRIPGVFHLRILLGWDKIWSGRGVISLTTRIAVRLTHRRTSTGRTCWRVWVVTWRGIVCIKLRRRINRCLRRWLGKSLSVVDIEAVIWWIMCSRPGLNDRSRWWPAIVWHTDSSCGSWKFHISANTILKLHNFFLAKNCKYLFILNYA